MHCVHLSELVSISPNSSLLPPLLELVADVAEAAEVVDTLEKEEEGFSGRVHELCPCCLLFMVIL